MKATHKLLIIASYCISIQTFAAEKLSVSESLNIYAKNQDRL